MLSIDHVTKKYGTYLALRDITLDFEKGVYGLLAPNGAGKTTLIKMLTTLLTPTQGEIRWEGTEIFALGEDYRDLLGYLPQQFGYYRDHTLRQFLRYLAALKGMEKKQAEGRITELMELVGLTEASNKKMKKFSGGMLQRVGIAGAMLNDPKILILDEPTAGLDPREQVRFRNLIHSVSKDRPYRLLSERQSEQGTLFRIFCEIGPSGFSPVPPNLEDVFLSVYGEKEVTGHAYSEG